MNAMMNRSNWTRTFLVWFAISATVAVAPCHAGGNGSWGLLAQAPSAASPASSPLVESPLTDDEAKASRWKGQAADAGSDAYVVKSNEIADSISQIRKTVVIKGTVANDVSVVDGDVYVMGTVSHDISVVSGNVTVIGTVGGNVSTTGGAIRVSGTINGSVSGGNIEKTSSAVIAGSQASSSGPNVTHFVRTFSRHFSPWDLGSRVWLSRLSVLVRTALVVLWAALAVLMAALFEEPVARAEEKLRAQPGQAALAGIAWLIAFPLLLIICALLSLFVVGLPLLALLVLFAVVVHLFGMTVVFLSLGTRLVAAWQTGNVPAIGKVLAGVCVLGLIRLLPLIGSLVWFVAGITG